MSEQARSTTYPDQNALALHTSMAYGEPMASSAINRNFHNILAHGIYEGFDCALAGGFNVTIAGTGDRHTLAARHDDVTLTVHAQHPVTMTVPAPGKSAIVVDSFYQFGVKTQQTDPNSAVKAAEYKIISLDEIKPHHVLVAEFDVPEGATELTEKMVSIKNRSNGGIGVDGHIKQYHPHTQYERVDNAADNTDVESVSQASKHVKLPQLWRAIAKKITEAFKGRRVNTEGPLNGGGNLGGDLTLTINSATTQTPGAVQLCDAVNSTSNTLAATAKAVKTTYDKCVSAYNLAASKWTFVAATTAKVGAVQLCDATNLKSSALAATTTAVKTAYDHATIGINNADTAQRRADEAYNLASSKWSYVTATTKRVGAVKLTNSVDSPSETVAASALAVMYTYARGTDAARAAATAQSKANYAYDLADKKLDKGAKAADAEKLDNISSSGFGRAYHGSLSTGGGDWTTAQFVAYLKSKGCFNTPYWMMKTSWNYSMNKRITDTGIGYIHLAGCVIEVMGTEDACTIRVTTPPTSGGRGVANAQFTYTNQGRYYDPSWRMDYNTLNKPSAADVGALTQAIADGRYLAKGSKAKDSARLNNVANSTSASANTIAQRDSSGDIRVRLVRSNYPVESGSTIPSASIAFRNTSNEGDNYIRFMTKAAMKAWLTLTKSDVGLSNVNNFTATSAINENCTTKFATAKAAKTAYDRGTKGVNAAATAQAKANSAHALASTLIKGAQGSGAPSSSQKPPVGGLFVRWD